MEDINGPSNTGGSCVVLILGSMACASVFLCSLRLQSLQCWRDTCALDTTGSRARGGDRGIW
jgi:hypothetical protein